MLEKKVRQPSRWFSILLLVLLLACLVSGVSLLFRYRPAATIEILLPPETVYSGEIHISGCVDNPGIYPFQSSESLASLLAATGGVSYVDNLRLTLSVIPEESNPVPQKININRAEKWLLEALPGIGATRSQAIIDYREKIGEFKHIAEIMQVDGIGSTLFEQIKDRISVSE